LLGGLRVLPTINYRFFEKSYPCFMNSANSPLLKKSIATLAILAAIWFIPSSFADELIQTIIEVATDPAANQEVVDETPTSEPPTPQAESDPSPAPSELIKPEPPEQRSPTDEAEEKALPSTSPTPSPSPTPPHAIANQSMRIIAPSQVAIDPRAYSVFLPRIYVANSGNLLVCAASSLGAFDANIPNISSGVEKSTLEISGAYTPQLRISGLGSNAATILNSTNGLRVFSPNRRLAGSYLHLRFVALSEVSANPKLCGDGAASNTRTIYLRGLGIDLNNIKGGVTLK
jgi:hypothetical protein